MRALVLLLAFIPLVAAFPATASSIGICGGPGGTPSLGIVEISPANDARATFYVDDRNYLLGNGLWIYEETNGIFTGGDPTRDLQRGGDAVISPYIPGGDSEICTDDPNVVPDTFFF